MTGVQTCALPISFYDLEFLYEISPGSFLPPPTIKSALLKIKRKQSSIVKHRLEIYHSQTEPLKGFYEEKGVLKRVPDLGGIEETNTKIMELLGK